MDQIKISYQVQLTGRTWYSLMVTKVNLASLPLMFLLQSIEIEIQIKKIKYTEQDYPRLKLTKCNLSKATILKWVMACHIQIRSIKSKGKKICFRDHTTK
jgi:hypothetical protein